MKIINEKKFKTLYPDSIISKNKLFYKQANDNLNLFLSNHFSHNNRLTYKFPIRKQQHPPTTKNSIRRKSTLVKERPKSSRKNNIRSIIDSLLHENYISYNFYDNTKGRLSQQLTRNKKKQSKAFKQKIFNLKNKSLNYDNTNIFSFEENTNTSKNNNFKSNYSLCKNSKVKKRHTTIVPENDNTNNNDKFRDSFPYGKYKMLLKRINYKNTSFPQTPNSTRYMSKMKNNSLKLDYDSLSINNNISVKRNSRNKSALSRRSINNSKSKNKIITINNSGENPLNNIKLNISDIEFSESQRKFHQKIYLQKLNNDIRKFEESNGYYSNEEEIKANLISPTKFQRDIFLKDIKRASKYNDFFFNRNPSNLAKLFDAKNKQNKRPQSPHQNFCDNESKKILFKIGKLDKKAKFTNHKIKNIDFRIRTKYMKRIIDYVVPVEHKVEDIDEEFKDETINYQKNIGKFFIYRGNGVYSGHLSSILRGDKIIKQAIKFKNL
jgi:hypothetical protein